MKQVEYRKNIPPAQNVNVKCESDLQFRPHLISTKARIPFFVFFFLSLVFWTAILDFCGGFRWQLLPRLPFPVPRSSLPVPRFSNIPRRRSGVLHAFKRRSVRVDSLTTNFYTTHHPDHYSMCILTAITANILQTSEFEACAEYPFLPVHYVYSP